MGVPLSAEEAAGAGGGKAVTPAMGELRADITRSYLETTYGPPSKAESHGDHALLYYDGQSVMFAVNGQGIVCLMVF
jgi:hypothetical protein